MTTTNKASAVQTAMSLAAVCLFVSTASAQPSKMVEPNAGTWKTWALNSGSEMRLQAPPSEAITRDEVRWLKDFMKQDNPVIAQQTRYWNAGAPSYRWIELFSERLRDGRVGVSIPSFRGYTLLSVAMYDATIAAWDSKYAYKRPRPNEFDPTLSPTVTTVQSPSYPSEHAVVAGAAAAVLAYLFPNEANHFNDLAEEAGRSRLLAGVQYPSDVQAGLELGRAVGRKVIEYARADRTDAVWAGTVPTGPGVWTGVNPGFITAPEWKPWFLSRANEFRPPQPPGHNSAERAAELAELKSMQRTFDRQAAAFFWQTPVGIHVWFFDELHRKLFETGLEQNAPWAARAYALLAMSHYDSHIASNDAKYTYWTIRPAQLDSSVMPVFQTPNHPSYPSNHSTHSAAGAEILAYLFPEDAEYFRNRAEEAGLSRLWAGIHYRSDHEAGSALGKAVGQKLISIARNDGSSPR